VQRFKPGEHFLKAGEISGYVGFVDEGVFRIYIVNAELEEATKYFMRKNQFMMDISNSSNAIPTWRLAFRNNTSHFASKSRPSR
jgi:CRP-like cAMP-binding protein